MVNMAYIETTWSRVGLPAIVFRSGGEAVYCNAAAGALFSGSLFDALPEEEGGALLAALRGEEPVPAPLFCRLGKDVYSAVLLDWAEYRVCLLQQVSDYYTNNQRALDEAIMANKAKTSFLSEMSHDIRTPMGAIIGLTEIALAQEGAPPKVRECLDKIKVASGHMMSLLNEVLDMSRIESGRVLLQPRPTNVADLLHEILVVARPQADAGKLRFRLEVGRVAREDLLADGVRLKQIILNLLSNAIKYTPAGGEVVFSFAVEPAEEPDRVHMAVQVEDTGIGMSAEFLKKVFEPFEREEKSTVSKIQGTGLGMAITKNLVELMGGRIAARSRPNEGSCFTMDIPLPAMRAPDTGAELAGKRVLLLDGDRCRAAQVMEMLAELGAAADWAADAERAVAFINDAALSDQGYYALLTAERIPGAEVTLFLPEVKRRLGGELPILMLSEGDWSQTEYMLTRAGVDAFIPLPLFQSRLAAGLSACSQTRDSDTDTLCGGDGYDFSGKRLLLVEDNELNREIALELLGETGIAIETAENGQLAVDCFSRSAPFYYDLVLMDVQMPVMNGLDATRAIRALGRADAALVPILAMTANAFVEDVKNALDAGMDAHISKPLDLERVFSTMEQFLRGGRG